MSLLDGGRLTALAACAGAALYAVIAAGWTWLVGLDDDMED